MNNKDWLDELGYHNSITRSDLNIVNHKIYIKGLEKIYRFYHISDMHICYAYPDDDIDEINFAKRQTIRWTPECNGFNPLFGFDKIIQEINKSAVDGFFISGDLLDVFHVSTLNYTYKKIKEINVPIYFAPGNHEGSIGGPTILTRNYYEYISKLCGGKCPDCQEYEFEHFIIAIIDDSDLKIVHKQIEFIKRLSIKNKPIILCMHIPVITDELEPSVMKNWGTTFMIGTYDDTDLTKEFARLIKDPSSNIEAILAGHIHYDNVSEFRPGHKQYVAAPGFFGYVNEIELIPEDQLIT